MEFFRIALCFEYFPKLLRFFPKTLEIAVISAGIGLFLGMVLGLIRLRKVPVLDTVVRVLVSFLRAAPPNVLLLAFFFAVPIFFRNLFLPLGVDLNRVDAVFYVCAAYGVLNAAFFSELVRASVLGVEKGQTEAGLSIGMTQFQVFWRIILPQAFRIALPELGNILINIVKNTSLAYLVGVVDLMGAIQIVSVETFHPLEGYIDVAVIYLLVSLLLEFLFSKLQRRLAYV